jgi:hypothetical protein
MHLLARRYSNVGDRQKTSMSLLLSLPEQQPMPISLTKVLSHLSSAFRQLAYRLPYTCGLEGVLEVVLSE